MGSLCVDILIYQSCPEDAEAGCVEAQAEKSPEAQLPQDGQRPENFRVGSHTLELRQPTYRVRRASYDFLGFKLELYDPMPEKVLDCFLQWCAARSDANGAASGMSCTCRPSDASTILLNDFSLSDPECIQSLEYLIGLINTEAMAKNFSADETESSASGLLKEALKRMGSVMGGAFGPPPRQIGSSFLQENLYPPLLVRLSNKKSMDGALHPLLVFQAPLGFLDCGSPEDIFLQLALNVSFGSVRMDEERMLMLEWAQPLLGEFSDSALAVVLKDFHSQAAGILAYLEQVRPGAARIDEKQVRRMMVMPFGPVDARENAIHWAYLKGRAILQQKSTVEDNLEQLRVLDGVVEEEARDRLLGDLVMNRSRKNQVKDALGLVEMMAGAFNRVSALAAVARAAAGRGDLTALEAVLLSAARQMDNMENLEPNLMAPLKDVVLVLASRLGLPKMKVLFPDNASPQVRLLWLSSCVRSAPEEIADNPAIWLEHCSALMTEVDQNPYLFVYLLDELVDLHGALCLIPQWRTLAEALRDKAIEVAGHSPHRAYYEDRLNAGIAEKKQNGTGTYVSSGG